MKKWLIGIPAFTMLLASLACGGTTPPETQPTPKTTAQSTAYFAYQSLSKLNTTSATLKTIYDSHTVPGFTPALAKQIAEFGFTANTAGEKLATLLEAYDLITDPAAKVSKQAEINKAVDLFIKAVADFGGVQAGGEVGSALTEAKTSVDKLIDQLKALIAQVKAPVAD